MIYIQKNKEQWGHLFSIQHDFEGRDLWVVEFPDGEIDLWPSYDAEADYAVRIQIEQPEGEPVHEHPVQLPSSRIRAAVQQLFSQVP